MCKRNNLSIRNIKNGVTAIYFVAICLWASLLLIISLVNITGVFQYPHGNNYINLVLFFILILEALYIFFFYCTKGRFTDNQIFLIIILIAFLIRIAFIPLSIYQPTSDFNNYFQAGCDFATNGFSSDYSLAENYGIWQFSGLSVLMGVQAMIFSPTLLGFQVSNCLITSIICGEIFLIGRKVDKGAAIIGAIFYTFYPTNIISSQTTNNQHGATMMTLAAIYLLNLAMEKNCTKKKSLILACLCAFCSVLANFYHPSAALLICTFIVYGIFYLLKFCKNVQSIKNCIRTVVTVIVAYFLILTCVQWIFTQIGYLNMSSLDNNILAGKLYVGSNIETQGGYSAEDYQEIYSYPYEDQFNVALRLSLERLNTPARALEHYQNKIEKFMLYPDNLLYFYYANYYASAQNSIEEIEEKYENGDITEFEYNNVTSVYASQIENIRTWFMRTMGGIDQRLLLFMWTFCAIGVFRSVKRKELNALSILIIFVMGWMFWSMLTELQPRYRYLAMPGVCLLAAYGIKDIFSLLRIKFRCLKKKR